MNKLSFILDETWTKFTGIPGNTTLTCAQLRLALESKHFGMLYALQLLKVIHHIPSLCLNPVCLTLLTPVQVIHKTGIC